MEKILLMADSPSDLNSEDIQDKPIWVIPVRIRWQGKEYMEFSDIQVREYWKLLEELEEIPVTSQVTPAEWVAYYTKAQNEGYTHIAVHTISATASGNYASACAGAKLFAEDPDSRAQVVVTDSRSYAFIYGRNVLRAAELIQEGKNFDEVCDALRELSRRNRAILWVYSLKHLKRSGRISGMSAIVGESLGIRPALLIKDGVIAPEDKVRGDRNIVPKAVELMKRHIVLPEEQDVSLIYADVPREEIDRALSLVCSDIKPRSVTLHEIGCAITTNCGPVSMALCFYGEAFPLREGARSGE